MFYHFKEYIPVFDTPMKKQQELVIARKIMDLLNKNKYDNLEEFIKKNDNYQDFLKKNDMTNVVKHFGNTLKEEDYVKIIENLRILTKRKQDFDKDNINTVNIEKEQFIHFNNNGENIFIDNSKTDKKIEDQMTDLQKTQQDFQTSNQLKNTENMFDELEKKKEVLNLHYLDEFNYNTLNEKEKQLLSTALLFEQNIDGSIQIDFDKKVIVDENNNIFKIENIDGEYVVIKGENGVKHNPTVKNKSYQKIMKPSQNTLYTS